MGGFAVALNALGLDLNFVYLFMGILIGSAVVPLWNMLMWSKANATGAIVAAWGGMALALATWLVVAKVWYAEVTLVTLARNEPMLAGNLMAIGSSGLIHLAFSMVSPQNYDFESMRAIKMLEVTASSSASVDGSVEELGNAKAWILKWGVGFSFVVAVGLPMLCLFAGVFSKALFAAWVVLSIVWGFLAAIVIIGLPLWESKLQLAGVVWTMTSRSHLPRAAAPRVQALPKSGNGSQALSEEALSNATESTV